MEKSSSTSKILEITCRKCERNLSDELKKIVCASCLESEYGIITEKIKSSFQQVTEDFSNFLHKKESELKEAFSKILGDIIKYSIEQQKKADLKSLKSPAEIQIATEAKIVQGMKTSAEVQTLPGHPFDGGIRKTVEIDHFQDSITSTQDLDEKKFEESFDWLEDASSAKTMNMACPKTSSSKARKLSKKFFFSKRKSSSESLCPVQKTTKPETPANTSLPITGEKFVKLAEKLPEVEDTDTSVVSPTQALAASFRKFFIQNNYNEWLAAPKMNGDKIVPAKKAERSFNNWLVGYVAETDNISKENYNDWLNLHLTKNIFHASDAGEPELEEMRAKKDIDGERLRNENGMSFEENRYDLWLNYSKNDTF